MWQAECGWCGSAQLCLHAGANKTVPATGTCGNWTGVIDGCPASLVRHLLFSFYCLCSYPLTQRLTPTIIGAAIALPSVFVLTVAGLWLSRQCGWLQEKEEDDEESRPAGRRVVGRRRIYKPTRLLRLGPAQPEKNLLGDD